MPSTIGPMIAEGAKRFRGYAERLTKDIQPGQFARKPTWGIGGAEINMNHAAWNYGHLAIYFKMIVEMAGGNGDVAAAPKGFEELFKDGTACIDDPSGHTYPHMETVLNAFFKGFDAAIVALEKADDAVFLKAPTDEKVKANWKTMGGREIFMVTNHIAMHLGQVSAWRRCMGLPAA